VRSRERPSPAAPGAYTIAAESGALHASAEIGNAP